MGRPIRYSTTTTSGSYQKGNVAIGTNPIGYSSGWYNSLTPTGGNFVVTEVIDANTPPRFYTPTNDDEWIRLAKQEGATGANTGSVAAVKSWFASQANYDVTNIELPLGMPNIVGDGLVLNLDASINESYPGSGTTWTDLSGIGSNGTLYNGPTFDTDGAIVFDGIDDAVQLAYDTTFNFQYTSSFTLECFAYINENTDYGFLLTNRASKDGNNIDFAGWGLLQTRGKIDGAIGGYSSGFDWRRATTSTTDFTNYVYQKWAHIVWSYDGTLAGNKLYINGNNATSQSFDDNTPPYIINYNGNQKVTLGRSDADGPGHFLNGKISQARIYNKALSLSEIQQNYYQAPIVTEGLVLAVDAGNLVSYESGSTTTYSMTGSYSGSLLNGTGYLPDNGGIWNFDGVDDYIDFGNQSGLGFTSGVFSVEAWVYIPSSWTAGSQYPNLVSKGASAGWDTDGWSLFCFRNYGGGTGYAIGIGLRNTGNINIRISYNQPSDTWLHVVGTLDGNSVKIYINGELQVNQSQTVNPAANNTNVYIGRDPSSQRFPGKIVGVRLYNQTLTADEVSQNFNAQRSRFGI